MPAITIAAINAGAQAGSSIINNTVSNLFDEKVRRGEIRLLDAKAERERMLTRLATLSNQQKFELDQELLRAKDATERYRILTDLSAKIAVAGQDNIGDILVAGVNSKSKNMMTTAIIIGVSLLALMGTLFFITKMEK